MNPTPQPPAWQRSVHWVATLMLVLSLGAAFLNIYLKEEITKIAYQLHQTDQERIALENEIHKLKVQIEELRSPAQVSAIAKRLGMDLIREEPIEIRIEK